MPRQSLQHLVNNLKPAAGSTGRPPEQERRSALRTEAPFPATVHGVDADGKRFKTTTVLGSLSPTHLYLWLAQRVEKGVRLFVFVRLSVESDVGAPRLALHGRVLRVDQDPEGRYGVVVEFSHHRFLYAAPS